jgi:hypothetical protein
MQIHLTREQEEWLIRAAFGSRRGVMPSAMVSALAAAGFGEPNTGGTLDVNESGLRYIREANLPTAVTTTRHRLPAAGR